MEKPGETAKADLVDKVLEYKMRFGNVVGLTFVTNFDIWLNYDLYKTNNPWPIISLFL